MTWRLRTRLTVSYAFLALLSVSIVGALANGVLEGTFRRYVQDARARAARQLAARVGNQGIVGGRWDNASIEAIGMAALEQGMILRVVDAVGHTVWDAMVHNQGLCVDMLEHMAQNMASRYRNWRGAYTERAYPIGDAARPLGTAAVGYYGPFYFSDEDLAFIGSLNRLLLWATLGALAVAVGLGIAGARRIAVPLGRVVTATQRIAAGHRDPEPAAPSRIRELDDIAAAVNDLSRALREQEELRKRLTADMAHELRTPLATLQSHLEALVDGVWEPDRGRLEALHEEILRVNRLVADMENLARYDANALALERSPTDLPSLIGRIVRNHEAQFAAKRVTVDLNAMPDSAPGSVVDVDADKLSQAVINLLSNALEFTPSGGKVTVSLESGEGASLIRVTDTGIGIAASELPRVFERFYRADASRSRATGGNGIGLPIARAIVEAHGGTVTVSSEPGAGSVFTIALPR